VPKKDDAEILGDTFYKTNVELVKTLYFTHWYINKNHSEFCTEGSSFSIQYKGLDLFPS
jgi:hypothetical protein